MTLEVGRAFEPCSDSVGSARRFVSAALQAWRVDVDLDAVALVTSELVTNSVIHAATEVRLAIRVDDTSMRVEVADDSERAPQVCGADVEATEGRGMTIVEQMCEQWGVDFVPDGGKVVWCQIGLGRPIPSR